LFVSFVFLPGLTEVQATTEHPAPAPLGLSARLRSYPVVGQAFSTLAGVYDQYAKHSTHATIRRCVDAVESTVSAHSAFSMCLCVADCLRSSCGEWFCVFVCFGSVFFSPDALSSFQASTLCPPTQPANV
jgi:hypothetical protein